MALSSAPVSASFEPFTLQPLPALVALVEWQYALTLAVTVGLTAEAQEGQAQLQRVVLLSSPESSLGARGSVLEEIGAS